MNTNRFPTNCTTCGTRVAAGAGRVAGKTNGRWNVTCSAHAARPAAARSAACDCGRPRCGGCDDTFDARRDG